MLHSKFIFSGWYGGLPGRPYDLPADDEERLAEARRDIRTLYDAGTPLYTKESLRDACQQLEQCIERGQKISIMGINGAMVDFEIETGRTLGPMNSEWERVVQEPFLRYFAFPHLTSVQNNDAPDFAYCSIRISHWVERRDKLTQEIIDPPFRHSFDEVEAFFQNIRAIWDISDTNKQLKSLLLSTEAPFRINKVVGFACASMTYDQECEITHRSAFQHALLLTLRDEFSKERGGDSADRIKCYVQDPEYTSTDKSVLNKHDITVLNDPKGFLEVDDSTLVFSCAPDAPIKEIISDLASPAVLIWDQICETESEYISTDPNSPRVMELARKYKEVPFPGDHKEHFGNVAIYVRQTVAPSSF